MADQPTGADAEPNLTDPAADPTAQGTESGPDASPVQDAPLDPEALAAHLAEMEAQLAEARDQALRWQAESENSRRRAAREVENAHKFALEKFTGELLPVLDSLEKAVDVARSASDATEGAAAEGAAAIAEGVELSLKLFRAVLEKSGVTLIDPLGEPFDPQVHEAMAMVENPDVEPNTVIDVMARGYSLNGRLVRAAMVIVSKNTG
ncbi:MAG: nucleotide exchange factor GrpE [Pseudomonadales bacterium]|nr:nucleotide exchange factor GrpE [Pseudomonadales bacterium]